MNDRYLYSPWRLDYILGEKSGDCILCRYQDLGKDEENLIFHRGRHCYAMLNRYPYNNGHIMLVPYLHASRLEELPSATLQELTSLMQLAETALNNVYNCDGINIGINVGRAAGAGIEEHLHMHLVPRWIGDSSFITVVSGERVIPESFERSYSLLRQEFAKLLSAKE